METRWRPKEGWRNPHKAEYKVKRLDGTITIEPVTRQQMEEHNIFEDGADALWKSVCDYIAELSRDCDDKMFRVKLFLWLTKEEKW